MEEKTNEDFKGLTEIHPEPTTLTPEALRKGLAEQMGLIYPDPSTRPKWAKDAGTITP